MEIRKFINESRQSHGADLNIKSKAIDLRRNMTDAEKDLWKKLKGRRQRGMYFRRQHPYGIYILDFYCFKSGLAIELDGEIHLNRKVYDKERTEYLESSGLKVLRFKNEDITNRIDWVLSVIEMYL
ncbi:MAG: endonuclease domain-containing protein [Bacteroidia bacterium]|nr:endonuclease domain-containing protein [Bacteroidia bacterium]